MQSNHHGFEQADDASECITSAFDGVDVRFSTITKIHESERHVVMKAKRFGRWWILKGLTPETDTEANRALLRKEFDIMMMLPSEGFVRAVSLEEIPGCGICIVMEHVEGLDLAEWMQTSPSPESRRRVAMALIDSIEHLHRLGIVSRDIKPSNIMITRLSQMPVIIDFDLADTDTHTVFKSPGGTANYISPEQATGFVPDCRNDIYSLAKTLSGMRLPRVWKPVLAKCLRKLDDRIPDAASLRQQILQAERRQRIIGRTAIFLTVAAALLIAYSLLPRTGAPAAVSQPAGKIASDTMTMVVHDTIAAPAENSAAMMDQINILTDSINSIQAERTRHQKKLEADTKEMCRKIRDYWERTAMRSLKNLKPGEKPDISRHLAGMAPCLEPFREKLRRTYSDAEMGGIELAISRQMSECYKEYHQAAQKYFNGTGNQEHRPGAPAQ